MIHPYTLNCNFLQQIAQNYWHSLHLNVKDSNFKFLPTFLILDLCLVSPGLALTVTKCKIPDPDNPLQSESDLSLATAHSVSTDEAEANKSHNQKHWAPYIAIMLRQTENCLNAIINFIILLHII